MTFEFYDPNAPTEEAPDDEVTDDPVPAQAGETDPEAETPAGVEP